MRGGRCRSRWVADLLRRRRETPDLAGHRTHASAVLRSSDIPVHLPRELVQRSAERLRQANIPVLGALLNNLDLHQYGYTYRKSYYDYYESNEDESGSEPSRKSA